jgi:predicted hydrolase (HD superfamily)
MKTKPVNQALQAIDKINAFIQALRAVSHEDEIRAICVSEITYIKGQFPEAETIAKRTISRYQSVVKARLGKDHPAVALIVWQ